MTSQSEDEDLTLDILECSGDEEAKQQTSDRLSGASSGIIPSSIAPDPTYALGTDTLDAEVEIDVDVIDDDEILASESGDNPLPSSQASNAECCLPPVDLPVPPPASARDVREEGHSNAFRTSPSKSSSYWVKWSAEEDALLHRGIEEFGFGKWTQIVRIIPDRSALQVKNRARHLFGPPKKRARDRCDGDSDNERLPPAFLLPSQRKPKAKKLTNIEPNPEPKRPPDDLPATKSEPTLSLHERKPKAKRAGNLEPRSEIKSSLVDVSPIKSAFTKKRRNSLVDIEDESGDLDLFWKLSEDGISDFERRNIVITDDDTYMAIRNELLEISRNGHIDLGVIRKHFSANFALKVFRLLEAHGHVNGSNLHANGHQGLLDPFALVQALIPPETPFALHIARSAMALMDFHAHLLESEVIGLLGGLYDVETNTVHIMSIYPCDSHLSSSSIQCEMDAISETLAREAFGQRGEVVVGWYHSHPTFNATPSVRDIENQAMYQRLFRRDDVEIEPFVGIIICPYHADSCTEVAKVTCFFIGDHYRTPYLIFPEFEEEDGGGDVLEAIDLSVFDGLIENVDSNGLRHLARTYKGLPRREKIKHSIRGNAGLDLDFSVDSFMDSVLSTRMESLDI